MAAGIWLWPSFNVGGSGGGIGGVDRSPSLEPTLPSDGEKGDEAASTSLLSHLSYGCDGFWSKSNTEVENADDSGAKPEMRMPEISSHCTSPGSRQGNTGDALSNSSSCCSPLRDANASARTASCGVSPPSLCSGGPPRARRPKRTTAAEAYNKGLVLQYLIENCADFDCCTWGHCSEDYHESNWKGHQPLARATWDSQVVELSQSCGTPMSPTEKRLMRRRRRRGIMSPTRRKSDVGNDVVDPVVPSFARESVKSLSKIDNIKFPGEVVDPHLIAKKKWEPHCDIAASDLPLPLKEETQPPGCCVLKPGCA